MPQLSRSLFNLVPVLALLSYAAQVEAQSIVADFENETPNVDLESLEIKDRGLKAEILRPDSNFRILGWPAFPAEWGELALSPFAVTSQVPLPFVVNFSKPVDGVILDSGDFGGDDDIVQLFAYDGPDGTGNRVGATRATLFNANLPGFTYVTMALESPGIRSIVFYGGSTFAPNSLYFDNITAYRLSPGKGNGKGNGKP